MAQDTKRVYKATVDVSKIAQKIVVDMLNNNPKMRKFFKPKGGYKIGKIYEVNGGVFVYVGRIKKK